MRILKLRFLSFKFNNNLSYTFLRLRIKSLDLVGYIANNLRRSLLKDVLCYEFIIIEFFNLFAI